jgi:hypothetical protein
MTMQAVLKAFTVAALVAVSAQPAAAADWSAQDIADGECIGFFAMELGAQTDENPDPGLVAIVSYFVGKVEGRNPGMDLTQLLTADLLLRLETDKTKIGERCSAEALQMGESMMRAGEALQTMSEA